MCSFALFRTLGPLTLLGTFVAMAACSGSSPRTPDAGAKGGQSGTLGSGGAGGTAGGAGGTAGGAGGADARSDAATATREEQACRNAIITQCERLKVCMGATIADCARYAADRCPDYYFGPHTLRTAENVEACVPLLREASCTDYLMGIATQCLLGGRGAAGDPCSSPAECASSWCSSIFGSCGTCGKPLGLGEPCGSGSANCASGTLCRPGTRTCVATPLVVPHAAAGEPCTLTGDSLVGCEGDLACVSGKCTPLPKQGEPCLSVSPMPRCAPGFFCGMSTADGGRANLCGNPAPCGTGTCDRNSFCYESPTAGIRCQPYVGSGEACSQASDSDRRCAAGFECVVKTAFDDAGRVYEGTCVPQRNQVDVGGACDHTNAFCRDPLVCQEGRCARFDPATCYQAKDAAADR
jgi:hypothetical protein